MDSLPEQHIDSLPKNLRDKAYKQVAWIWAARMQGINSEKVLATKADFPSVEAMHVSLQNWGLMGMLPGHCKEPKKKRKPRGGGEEKRKLPPASAAAELFRGVLKRLERDISELSRRQEYIRGERFVVGRHFSGDAGEAFSTYYRGDMSDAAWRVFCEGYGEDPGDPLPDSLTVWEDHVVPGRVSWAPPEPLTRLIAVYLLSGEPLEPLLRVLHDDPETVDKDQLEKNIYGERKKAGIVPGLVSRASTVARLIRGGIVRTGPRTLDLDRREEQAVGYIQIQRSRGVSDEKILQELWDGHGFTKPVGLCADPEEATWPDMTMDDLKRLGNFQLPSIFQRQDSDT